MRFIKAYIDGYGKFHNLDFVFEPGFNLFFGPNEAGKTTMMSFLRTIFFGFPGKKSASDCSYTILFKACLLLKHAQTKRCSDNTICVYSMCIS